MFNSEIKTDGVNDWFKPSTQYSLSGIALLGFFEWDTFQEKNLKTVDGRIKAIAVSLFITFPVLTICAVFDLAIALHPFFLVLWMMDGFKVNGPKHIVSSLALPIIALFGAFIGRLPQFSTRHTSLDREVRCGGYTLVEYFLDRGEKVNISTMLETSRIDTLEYLWNKNLKGNHVLDSTEFQFSEVILLNIMDNYLSDREDGFYLHGCITPFIQKIINRGDFYSDHFEEFLEFLEMMAEIYRINPNQHTPFSSLRKKNDFIEKFPNFEKNRFFKLKPKLWEDAPYSRHRHHWMHGNQYYVQNFAKLNTMAGPIFQQYLKTKKEKLGETLNECTSHFPNSVVNIISGF